MNFNPQEKTNILAALRFFQANTNESERPRMEHFYADDVIPLSNTEIDSLCEAINFSQDNQHWEKTFYAVLSALYSDLADVGDDKNPESKEEYGSCQWARETLEAYSKHQANNSEELPYTIIGLYEGTDERFAFHVYAENEVIAENAAKNIAQDEISIAGVITGHLSTAR